MNQLFVREGLGGSMIFLAKRFPHGTYGLLRNSIRIEMAALFTRWGRCMGYVLGISFV